MLVEWIYTFDFVIKLEHDKCGMQCEDMSHMDENECLIDFTKLHFPDFDIPWKFEVPHIIT
jgi:hypothetical protein